MSNVVSAPARFVPAPNDEQSFDGVGRRQVAEIQRTRIVAAMIEAASELGAANVAVSHVVERAGVSRRTFYELFAHRDDCFLAALDDVLERAEQRLLAAYASAGGWRERTRAALLALLGFLDEQPSSAHVLVVESLGAGRPALARRARAIERLAGAIDRAAAEAKTGAGVTPLTAQGIVGAVLEVVHARLVAGEHRPLVELVNPLMCMIVLPYLGPAAARREWAKPDEDAMPARRAVHDNPLQGLGIRLTYRTVRVLSVVAASPRSSNRAIAEAAEVGDQGQISKLLARLERVGLIENGATEWARGDPNAWVLTERGRQLQDALAGGAVRV